MVLTPDGIDFAPYPMLVETDRDKYAIQRIVDFYCRQPTDLRRLFRGRLALQAIAPLSESPRATLASIAADAKVSAKYLPMVWQILQRARMPVGPIAKLQAMWRALPAPAANQADAAARAVRRDARFRGQDPQPHGHAVRRAGGEEDCRPDRSRC